MRFTSIVLAAACTVMVLATPALAANDEQGSVRQACTADFAKFCSGQDMQDGKGRGCMRQHWTELSQPCQSAIQTRTAERTQRIKAACTAEIGKFCNTAAPADEHIGRCLRDHKDELSGTCKAAFPNRRS